MQTRFNGLTIPAKSLALALATLIFSGYFAAAPGAARAESTSESGDLFVTRSGQTSNLHWNLKDQSQSYVLYRDGEAIKRGKGDGQGQDQLGNLSPATYVLDMSRPMKADDLTSISDKDLRVSISRNFDKYSTTNIIGVVIGAQGGANSASATPTAVKTLFRYQSFIGDSTVKVSGLTTLGCPNGPVVPSGSDYFLGDGRGYSADPGPNAYSPAYRTRFDVTVDWNAKTVTASPSVGVTNLMHFASDGSARRYSMNPDKSSMVIQANPVSTAARFSLNQDVHDPFCNSNGIWVSVIVNISRSGSFSVTGQRIQVPYQEVYIKDSDVTSWTTILRAAPLTMDCLIPGVSGALGCVASVSTSGSR